MNDLKTPGIESGREELVSSTRPPLPPFTRETAIQKVRAAEDGWNSREPERVALAYTLNSHWRNRSEFLNGRPEIIEFLKRKWAKELEYRLIKELWAFDRNRIAVRFAYEWHDETGKWFRSYRLTANSGTRKHKAKTSVDKTTEGQGNRGRKRFVSI
jgi:nuclear transport factor 2 (NTF2) superfamily protein